MNLPLELVNHIIGYIPRPPHYYAFKQALKPIPDRWLSPISGTIVLDKDETGASTDEERQLEQDWNDFLSAEQIVNW
jgi:hypothetical protein